MPAAGIRVLHRQGHEPRAPAIRAPEGHVVNPPVHQEKTHASPQIMTPEGQRAGSGPPWSGRSGRGHVNCLPVRPMKTNYASEAGSIRLGLFIVVIMIGCFWKGGQDLYTALTNTKPTVMSYDDYVQKRPKANWLKLTNCRLSLPDAAFKSYGRSQVPTELFIPVESAESDEGGKTVVLLATRSPEFLATCREMMNLKSESESIAWMLKNHERVFPKRDISGLVRGGLELKEKERSQLAKLQDNAVSDFIMLEDGEKPSLTSGLGFSGAGFLMLVGGIVFLRKSRDDSPTDI
jgi:hypothetical protein